VFLGFSDVEIIRGFGLFLMFLEEFRLFLYTFCTDFGIYFVTLQRRFDKHIRMFGVATVILAQFPDETATSNWNKEQE